jgi:hypothetical protein
MVETPRLACDRLLGTWPKWLQLEEPHLLSWARLSRASVVISPPILHSCVISEPDVLGIERMFRVSLFGVAARRLMLGSRRRGPLLPHRLY